MTQTKTDTLRDKLIEILDSHFRLTLRLDLDEDIPDAADDIVQSLTEMGRLLPEGGTERIEYGVRVDRPHPRRTEKAGAIMGPWAEENCRYAPSIWNGWTTMQRTIRTWPGGAKFVGAWVEVRAAEATGETA